VTIATLPETSMPTTLEGGQRLVQAQRVGVEIAVLGDPLHHGLVPIHAAPLVEETPLSGAGTENLEMPSA